MAVKVSYKHGTKQTYLNLAERSPYALYWCEDTRELFKGDELYSDGVRITDSYSNLPEFTKAADGILYVCTDTGNGYVLNTERNGWIPVFYGIDNETIALNENGLMAVKQVPINSVNGLEDRLSEIEKSIVAGAPIASADIAGIVKASDEIAVSEDGTMTLVAVQQSKVTGLEERLGNIEAAAVGGIHYKGSVPSYGDLPQSAEQGDLYEVELDNSEWCWNGEKWFEYGKTTNLSPIATAEINPKQFIIQENTLSMIGLESRLVQHRGKTLDQILDEVSGAIIWEEMATQVKLTDSSSAANAIASAKSGDVLEFSEGAISNLTLDKSVTCLLYTSLLLAGITTYLCSPSDRRSLPVNLSVIGVSYLYVGACALANILIGWIFKLEPSVFLAIHLAVLAIFTVILILLFAARSIITAQHKNQDKNGCQENNL